MPTTSRPQRLPRCLILVLALLLASFVQGGVHLHSDNDSAPCFHCQVDHNPGLVVAAPPVTLGQAIGVFTAAIAPSFSSVSYPGYFGRAPPLSS